MRPVFLLLVALALSPVVLVRGTESKCMAGTTSEISCTPDEAAEYCVSGVADGKAWTAACSGCLALTTEEQTRYYICTCPPDRSMGDGKVAAHDGTGCEPSMCPTASMAATPAGVTMACGTNPVTGLAYDRCDRDPDTLIFPYQHVLEFTCPLGHVNTKCQSDKFPWTRTFAGAACDSEQRVCQSDRTFSGSMPACAPIQCGQADYVHNAYPETKCVPGQAGGRCDMIYQTEVDYVCHDGYQIANASANATLVERGARICQADGMWSAEVACEPKNCGAPGSPTRAATTYKAANPWRDSRGEHTAAANAYMSSYSYACDTGTKIDPSKGASDILCQADGTWSDRPAHCEPIVCGEPTTALPAQVVVTDASLAATRADAQKATVVSNSSAQGSAAVYEYAYQAAFKLACAPGYEPAEQGSTTNRAGDVVNVTEIDSTYTCTGAAGKGYEARTSATTKSTRVGDGAVLSTTTSSYDDFPHCVRIECSAPPNVTEAAPLPAAKADGSPYLFEDTVTVQCTTGHATETSKRPVQTLTCGSDGQFSAPEPCRRVECELSTLPPVENGIQTTPTSAAARYAYGDAIAFQCQTGYTMWHADHNTTTSGAMVCDYDTIWKPEGGVTFGCDDCGTVDTKDPATGEVVDYFDENVGSVKREQSDIFYQCDKAYDLAIRTDTREEFVTKLNADRGYGGYNDDRYVPKGTNETIVTGMEDGWVFSRRCVIEGQSGNHWTGLQPACKPITCPVPGTKRGAKIPEHGVVADRVSTCMTMTRDSNAWPAGDPNYRDAYCDKSTYRMACGDGYVQNEGDSHLYTCGSYGIWRVQVDFYSEMGDREYFTCSPAYGTITSQYLLYGYAKSAFTLKRQHQLTVGLSRMFNVSSEAIGVSKVGDEVPEAGVTPTPFWVEFKINVTSEAQKTTITSLITQEHEIATTQKIRDFGLYSLTIAKVMYDANTRYWEFLPYNYVPPAPKSITKKVWDYVQGLSGGAIAAIIIVMLLVVAVIAFIIWRKCWRKDDAFYGGNVSV